jgi:phosphoenolpyruvate-protein kinase (PTS system EI component)
MKKKSILIMAAMVFVAGTVLTSCSSSAEKVDSAEQDVQDANEALDKANQEYLIDIENYRKTTAEKVEANNKSIAEFNARIANDKKAAKADYQKKIAELEKKNTDMKKRLDDYNAEGKDNWEKFKYEFGRDMDALGQAFKDFTVSDKK